MNKKYFVLSLAPTGIIPSSHNTQHATLYPKQLAAVLDNIEVDVSAVHLHARDEKEQHSGDPARYADYIATVRERSRDTVVCVSCSGRLDPSFEARSKVLELTGDLRPDMGSLTLSSLNFPNSASVNTPDTIIRLAAAMGERGIKPELEVFDLGMMNFAHYLIKKGYIEPPYYFNFILGNIAGAQAKASHIDVLLSELPEDSIWNIGGIGLQQAPAIAASLALGGGVRTGLEDNLWLDDKKTQAARNEDLVAHAVFVGDKLGRRPMPAAMLRERLGFSSQSFANTS